jgi:hypothetical protein
VIASVSATIVRMLDQLAHTDGRSASNRPASNILREHILECVFVASVGFRARTRSWTLRTSPDGNSFGSHYRLVMPISRSSSSMHSQSGLNRPHSFFLKNPKFAIRKPILKTVRKSERLAPYYQ